MGNLVIKHSRTVVHVRLVSLCGLRARERDAVSELMKRLQRGRSSEKRLPCKNEDPRFIPSTYKKVIQKWQYAVTPALGGRDRGIPKCSLARLVP